MTRNDVINNAVIECLKELYSWAIPEIDWEEFIKENKIYNDKYKEWEVLENRPPILEYCGPRPYEFYYLPSDIFNDIKESYVYAYKLNSQEELLTTIKILKDYCEIPIIDKWIEGENGEPGHRGYDHPDNLKKELQKIFDDQILPDICKQYNKQYNLQTTGIESSVSIAYSQRFQDKFFEFLDMAGKFYNWNHELNTFNMSVFMGIAPSTNKEKVIDYWKKYRNKDIEIDEKQMKEDYYGEELD